MYVRMFYPCEMLKPRFSYPDLSPTISLIIVDCFTGRQDKVFQKMNHLSTYLRDN